MWKTFWFDGNKICKVIKSQEDWVAVVEAYKNQGGVKHLREARENSNADIGMPSFGFYIEHDGSRTLGMWADENEVNLNV